VPSVPATLRPLCRVFSRMASTSTVAPPAQNTAKRDFLIALEHKAQQKWAAEKAFETTSPFLDGTAPVPTDNFADAAAAIRKDHPKWMGTFPYAVSTRTRPAVSI